MSAAHTSHWLVLAGRQPNPHHPTTARRRTPDIVARNTDGGITVTMKLPLLDERTLRVRYTEATKVRVGAGAGGGYSAAIVAARGNHARPPPPPAQEICIAAKPDLTPLYEQLSKLPREMRARALAITLDLKVVGKERYDPDDLSLAFDAASETCTVELKRAFLREYVACFAWYTSAAAQPNTPRTSPSHTHAQCRKATSSPLKVVGTCVGAPA